MSVSVSMSVAVDLGVGGGQLPAGGIRVSQGTFSSLNCRSVCTCMYSFVKFLSIRDNKYDNASYM